jgi:hypothetical protein
MGKGVQAQHAGLDSYPARNLKTAYLSGGKYRAYRAVRDNNIHGKDTRKKSQIFLYTITKI